MTKVTRSILLVALLLAIPVGCGVTQTSTSGGEAAPTSATPGWTGRTFVVGSNSTIEGNAAATYLQQKWQLGPAR